MLSRTISFLLLVVAARPLVAADAAPTREAVEFFEKKVRPVLVESCYECHSASAKKIKGELRVDGRDHLIKGGESGTSLVPGDPAKSRLIDAISYKNADLQMPPKKKLSSEAIEDLTRWVQMGAPWPAEAAPATSTGADTKPAIDFEARKLEHWAWQPVKKHEPPKVTNERWPLTDIDRFILAKLEAKNLRPAPPADPRTLIRRVYYDLIGLPPSPQEVEAFVKEWEQERSKFQVSSSKLKTTNGDSPASQTWNLQHGTWNSPAFAALVDRLLASPAYGERWARHWLDVVRYADSKDSRGQGGEVDIPFAYRYRDWVVDAFNRDLPYDQFVMQQIAGDLMMGPEFRVPGSGSKKNAASPGSAVPNQKPETRNPELSPYAPLIATTMLAIGNWETGCSDKRKMMTDIVDDQIDIVSRGFLGMTVSCARCHDHKFDPIGTRDYYALAGFFFSSHIIPAPGDPTAGTPMLRIPLMPDSEVAAIRAAAAQVEAIKKQINDEIDARRREVVARELSRLTQYLAAAAEYHRRDPRDESITLSAIAAKHSVHSEMLKRVVAYLGLGDGAGAIKGLFTTKLSEVLQSPAVSGWGSPQTPMVLAHTGTQAVKLLTFTLPPRSIAMHPSPDKHIAIGWRSPIKGTVRITGKVADADANCGNGFTWSLVLRRGPAVTVLTTGTVASGAAQELETGENAKKLDAVQVEPGDLLSVIVDAKAKDHTCDTTIIDLAITDAAGKRTWDVTKDLVDSIHAGNPHADSHGNRDVWHLYAISSDAGGAGAGVPAGSVLASWLAIVIDRTAEPADANVKKKLTDLAATVQSLATSDGKNREPADTALFADLTSIATSPIWSPIDLIPYSESDPTTLDLLKSRLDEQTKIASRKIEFAQGIREGGVPGSEHAGTRDAKVHIRGRYDRLGDIVPRGFPALIAPKPFAASRLTGSGRLELAKWIASKENPMTARVMVNRLWQHHFGRGLVATPDNFGHLGDRPSHPELLDYLAVKFVESGWSIKAMHKLIVTSAVYQQESRHEGTKALRHEGSAPATRNPEPGTRNSPSILDPDNRLLWRQNRRRLDAEQLRDAMLVAAGRYDARTGPTPGPATTELNAPRRTLYLMAVRSDTAGYRTLFDAADPNTSIHARGESTVAPQALFMLNHPFALAITDALAARVLREGGDSNEKRIAWLYETIYARPVTPKETEVGLRMLSANELSSAWKQYCQILLCANEFLYVD